MSLSSLRRMDYVILLCRDLAAMQRFYQDVLGFSLVEDQESWKKFQVGETFLTLRPRGPWRGWDDGQIDAGVASVQLAFRVEYDEVDVCHAELQAQGVAIIEPPRDQHFGHRTLFFRDPDDNVVEIYAEI